MGDSYTGLLRESLPQDSCCRPCDFLIAGYIRIKVSCAHCRFSSPDLNAEQHEDFFFFFCYSWLPTVKRLFLLSVHPGFKEREKLFQQPISLSLSPAYLWVLIKITAWINSQADSNEERGRDREVNRPDSSHQRNNSSSYKTTIAASLLISLSFAFSLCLCLTFKLLFSHHWGKSLPKTSHYPNNFS